MLANAEEYDSVTGSVFAFAGLEKMRQTGGKISGGRACLLSSSVALESLRMESDVGRRTKVGMGTEAVSLAGGTL